MSHEEITEQHSPSTLKSCSYFDAPESPLLNSPNHSLRFGFHKDAPIRSRRRVTPRSPVLSSTTSPLRNGKSRVKALLEQYQSPPPTMILKTTATNPGKITEDRIEPFIRTASNPTLRRRHTNPSLELLDLRKDSGGFYEGIADLQGDSSATLSGKFQLMKVKEELKRPTEDCIGLNNARSHSADRIVAHAFPIEKHDASTRSVTASYGLTSPVTPLGSIPLHVSPFNYALEPFLNENPRYRNFVNKITKNFSGHSSISTASTTSCTIHKSPVRQNFRRLALRDDSCAVRTKVLRAKMTLFRCELLERRGKMLEQGFPRSTPEFIEKKYWEMRSAAEAALDVATTLQDDGLQARCHYWYGRACGALRDWDAACENFTESIRLDNHGITLENDGVKSDGSESAIRIPCTGLTQRERADVRFLKQSVRDRSKNQQWNRNHRLEEDKVRARNEKNRVGEPTENTLVRTASPIWKPHVDGIQRLWLEETYRDEVMSEYVDVSEHDSMAPWPGAPLTAEELDYIENGDRRGPNMRWKNRCQAPLMIPPVRRRTPSQMKFWNTKGSRAWLVRKREGNIYISMYRPEEKSPAEIHSPPVLPERTRTAGDSTTSRSIPQPFRWSTLGGCESPRHSRSLDALFLVD